MICVPLNKKTIPKLLADFDRAQKIADLTEIWFDNFESSALENNLDKIFKRKKKPILYKSFGDLKKLKLVLSGPIDYIDLDLGTASKIIEQVKILNPKTKIILSHHDFKKTPKESELKGLIKKMQKKGADIVKLATQANNFADSLLMLKTLDQTRQMKQHAICVCMGKEGIITRAAGHLFGNYLMYAPLDLKDSTAKGQLTFRQLSEIQNLI